MRVLAESPRVRVPHHETQCQLHETLPQSGYSPIGSLHSKFPWRTLQCASKKTLGSLCDLLHGIAGLAIHGGPHPFEYSSTLDTCSLLTSLRSTHRCYVPRHFLKLCGLFQSQIGSRMKGAIAQGVPLSSRLSHVLSYVS
jgi:hypothetical protein